MYSYNIQTMNHLHHTNHHASTLGEMQRLIAGLAVSITEIKAAQGSPISFASLEESVTTLKTKMDSLATLEVRVEQQERKVSNVENRLGFLESREPKIPPSLENSLQLKLEHYLTKCVKERIDMLNVPLLKVQLEEKITNLVDQMKTLSKPTDPDSPLIPSQPELPLTTAETSPVIPENSDDIDISFIKRRPTNKKTK